ncbi:hypothetical protein VM1G_06574 [Cytospora mali]|uniref:LITAF domain-containing protein n=1 Tax=Cytospora mali TaxID=578113 RepID=A0A194W3X2_CYTMA|nr:hypothetical protein VM1G_06574 [Valsa mali]
MSHSESSLSILVTPTSPQVQDNSVAANHPMIASDRRPSEAQQAEPFDAAPEEVLQLHPTEPVKTTSDSRAPPARGLYHSSIGHGSLSRANVVPLSLLKRWPATVECPACGELTHTNTRFETGNGTHWMATLLFFTTAVGVVVPYMSDFAKNVQHNCLRCGRTLATHHFGSGTEVHLV